VGGKRQQQHTSSAVLVLKMLCPTAAFIADVAFICSGMTQE